MSESPAAAAADPEAGRAELQARVLELLADGNSLKKISEMPGMPGMRTMHRWVAEDETFRAQYVVAREAFADHVFEEILAIADDSAADVVTGPDGKPRTDWEVVGRARVRIDARKWYLARLAPKKYGDALHLEHSGAITTGAPKPWADMSRDERLEVARRIIFGLHVVMRDAGASEEETARITHALFRELWRRINGEPVAAASPPLLEAPKAGNAEDRQADPAPGYDPPGAAPPAVDPACRPDRFSWRADQRPVREPPQVIARRR